MLPLSAFGANAPVCPCKKLTLLPFIVSLKLTIPSAGKFKAKFPSLLLVKFTKKLVTAMFSVVVVVPVKAAAVIFTMSKSSIHCPNGISSERFKYLFSLFDFCDVKMAELRVNIPKELESEFKAISKPELSMLVSKVLKDKLLKIIRFKKIVSKSKLTEEQAEELADEVSESLAKRYDKLLSKSKG